MPYFSGVRFPLRSAYQLAGTVATLAAHLVPPGHGKVRRSLRARRNLLNDFRRQATALDRNRPLVWFHAPSVGEGLQARPIIDALRARRPDIQVAYTFFSPSAEQFANGLGADVVGFLPFDTKRNAEHMLDVLQPAAIVFAKLDVWPLLVERAAARRIPVLLLSATVAPGSGRLGTFARALTRDAYASLAAVGAIDNASTERLGLLGVKRERIRVTGDTRFDQVAARARSVEMDDPLLVQLESARPTLVAGSTWPADERVLLPAFQEVLQRARSVRPRLVIAPHEPTESHLAPIEHWARNASYTASRLSNAHGDCDIVIIDRVGILGKLYALAQVAFVGGGFHGAGLHSVIEPAAFGVPVIFGPQHSMSREAGMLLSALGGVSVADAVSLSRELETLLFDAVERGNRGAAARVVVEENLGATVASVEILEEYLRF